MVLVMPATAALQSATQTRLAGRRKKYPCLGKGTVEVQKDAKEWSRPCSHSAYLLTVGIQESFTEVQTLLAWERGATRCIRIAWDVVSTSAQAGSSTVVLWNVDVLHSHGVQCLTPQQWCDLVTLSISLIRTKSWCPHLAKPSLLLC